MRNQASVRHRARVTLGKYARAGGWVQQKLYEPGAVSNWKAFASVQDVGPLQKLFVGDYRLTLGQGLLLDNNADLMARVSERTQGLYNDLNENPGFGFRGGAAELGYSRFGLVGFYSKAKRDAILNPDSTVNWYIVSTPRYSTYKDNLTEDDFGGSLRFDLSRPRVRADRDAHRPERSRHQVRPFVQARPEVPRRAGRRRGARRPELHDARHREEPAVLRRRLPHRIRERVARGRVRDEAGRDQQREEHDGAVRRRARRLRGQGAHPVRLPLPERPVPALRRGLRQSVQPRLHRAAPVRGHAAGEGVPAASTRRSPPCRSSRCPRPRRGSCSTRATR